MCVCVCSLWLATFTEDPQFIEEKALLIRTLEGLQPEAAAVAPAPLST